MFHLPTPYPDELLGSVLIRAQRITGLGRKLLFPALIGPGVTAHSPVLTRSHMLAASHGMSLEDFLRRHSLLPYATAYMSDESRQEIWLKMLAGGRATSFAALAAHATRGVEHYRLCPHCVASDLATMGESYWHRSHHLPGCAWCLQHERPLKNADLRLCATECRLLLPHEAAPGDQRANQYIARRDNRRRLATASVSALFDEMPRGNASHRAKAAELGYKLHAANVWGQVLAQDLRRHYGDRFLELLGSPVTLERNNWPSMLVRPTGGASSSARHALMEAFLASNPSPSRAPMDYVHRKKPCQRDWPAFERKALATMKVIAAKHAQDMTRVTVTELMERVGLSGAWKHRRNQLTEIRGWVDEFKASPQSERQTGRRPKSYAPQRR